MASWQQQNQLAEGDGGGLIVWGGEVYDSADQSQTYELVVLFDLAGLPDVHRVVVKEN